MQALKSDQLQKSTVAGSGGKVAYAVIDAVELDRCPRDGGASLARPDPRGRRAEVGFHKHFDDPRECCRRGWNAAQPPC
jgi:hypothetical protein